MIGWIAPPILGGAAGTKSSDRLIVYISETFNGGVGVPGGMVVPDFDFPCFSSIPTTS